MNIESGDFTVGDVALTVRINNDSTLSGSHQIHFLKPNGVMIRRNAAVSGVQAYYTWVDGDLDVAGDWHAFLFKVSGPFYYKDKGQLKFRVRPKPETMGKLET